MNARRLGYVGAIVAATLLLVGCGSARSSPEPTTVLPDSPVVGVLTSVDSSSLAEVRGFGLRVEGGAVLRFRIVRLENEDEFPPGHLAEHLAGSHPVRVWFTTDGADLIATRIEDAGG